MQKSNTTQNKTPLGKFLGDVISYALAAVIIIYIGFHTVSSLKTELMTEYALQVTENDVAEFDAYILRNETVLYAEKEGVVGYDVPDGSKVNTGSKVASIYNSSPENNDRSDIITLDRVIELLTESNNVTGMAASDTSSIDSRIDSFYNVIRESSEQGIYNNLSKRRDELLVLLNKRQIITGKIDSFDGIIQKYEDQRDELKSSLDAVSEPFTTPVSGFFYSDLDGYESVFNTASVSSMTPELFDNMLASEPTEYPSTAIGKVTTDFNWYIVTEATRDDLRYYTEGRFYRVIFPYNNDTELSMKLHDVVAIDGNPRILLIFASSEAPEDFSYRRMQPVKVVRNSFTGYKVPISAARLVDGRMGVYILKGSTVDLKYIDVIEEFDGFYIVAPQDPANDENYHTKLGLYDLMIIGGKDIYKGKLIS